MKSAIVIPARLASTRLPRKMLLSETGKTLIEHTFRSASTSQLASRVVVATDHQEIAAAVHSFGGAAIMTDPNHKSGTDRVAEVAAQMPDIEIFVNVQGDEPEISSDAIDRAIERLQQTPSADVATLATPIRSAHAFMDPACVKVVFADSARALYFSRSPIPMPRGLSATDLATALSPETPDQFFQHIGLYAYHRDFLAKMPTLPQTALEQIESLEQLRFLESGYSIYVDVIDHATSGIDTPEDYELFVKRQSNC